MVNPEEAVRSVDLEGEPPWYEVSDDEMGLGASLGNGHAWVTTGTDGRILSLFSTDVGQTVAGPLLVRYATGDSHTIADRLQNGRQRLRVPLEPTRPGSFTIHPAYQRHSFRLPGGIEVEETVFVPLAEHEHYADECAALYMIRLTNTNQHPASLHAYAFARLQGRRLSGGVEAVYDGERRAIFAAEPDQPEWVRVLATDGEPSGHILTPDVASTYDAYEIPELNGPDEATGDLMCGLEVPLEMQPGESRMLTFLLAFECHGPAETQRIVKKLLQVDRVFTDCLDHCKQALKTCRVATPDPVINAGTEWSKVNMMRVLAHYPTGRAFTNEPGVSSNVVIRDVIWFIYGCDHFMPEASRDLLRTMADMQYETGKMPEYYDARTGDTADYDMNINDGTPLFILGMNHHIRSTGDMEFLEEMYEPVRRASDYILSQIDDRGLVHCSAEGTEVYGICSWRNVIPDYQINGAVTEINAECAAALRAMGHMGDNTGRERDGQYYRDASNLLRQAINEHLLDPARGLYALNIDTQGRRHTDVTADQVFPVLFRVADDEVAYQIIRRLDNPDFWTPAGLRTVSRLDPHYRPAENVGLMGGVWPGMTWWYAFAAARYHPEFMVRGLHASFEHYARNPRVFNTVPGQFSEWFDGESLINRGMRLSPWEPPRFLWAAVEGIGGLMVLPGKPRINPLRSPDWLWTGVYRVQYHGEQISFFNARMGRDLHIFGNVAFDVECCCEVFEEDLSDQVRPSHAGVHAMAFRSGGRIVIAIGSCRDRATITSVQLDALLEPDTRYVVRYAGSERGEWARPVRGAGRDFMRYSMRLESKGYHLIELKQRD